MDTSYEVVSLFDRGEGEVPIPSGTYPTISDAFEHLTSAGDYIVAVENNSRRPLTVEEECEYERLFHHSPA